MTLINYIMARDIQINIRLDDEEAKMLEEASRYKKGTKSAFARSALFETIDLVLAQKRARERELKKIAGDDEG